MTSIRLWRSSQYSLCVQRFSADMLAWENMLCMRPYGKPILERCGCCFRTTQIPMCAAPAWRGGASSLCSLLSRAPGLSGAATACRLWSCFSMLVPGPMCAARRMRQTHPCMMPSGVVILKLLPSCCDMQRIQTSSTTLAKVLYTWCCIRREALFRLRSCGLLQRVSSTLVHHHSVQMVVAIYQWPLPPTWSSGYCWHAGRRGGVVGHWHGFTAEESIPSGS